MALHFVDTVTSKDRHESSTGRGRKNSFEVELACAAVRLLDKRCPRKLALAVISMYSDQVNALTRALGAESLQRSPRVDTVDAFEGQDEDTILISTARSNRQGTIGFLELASRLSVAVSRAKHLVVCLGDSSTLCSGAKGKKLFAPLIEASKKSGGYSPAAKILRWQSSKVRSAHRKTTARQPPRGAVGQTSRPATRSSTARPHRNGPKPFRRHSPSETKGATCQGNGNRG